jgi:septum formation protein
MDPTMNSDGFWNCETPLVLASKSAARQALLAAAGIPFETVASGIDERVVDTPMLKKGAFPADIAAALAQAKAQAVSAFWPGRLVLGADQTLSLDGRIYTKPATLAEAHTQLLGFELHAALCIMRDGKVLFESLSTARLTCRNFDSDFVDRYMKAAGDSVLASVGAYQLEGLGIHLFETVDGDQATILGLPLLPLLAFLRREGSLAG